jgi:hypothetical protein
LTTEQFGEVEKEREDIESLFNLFDGELILFQLRFGCSWLS